MGTLSSSFQSAVVGITAGTGTLLHKKQRVMSPGRDIREKYILQNSRDTTHLFLSTVTFFSILQVTVAAALPPIHGSGIWQVEETLPSSRAQVALQLLQVTGIEHTGKWMPVAWWGRSTNIVCKTCFSAFLFSVSLIIYSVSYPVAAAMIQPPSSALAWQQPVLSWLMPKLWPISCAMVAATPTADSEWSYSKEESKFT